MMTLLFLAQAIGKVKEHLEAQVAKNPESKLFCKALGEYMKGFPEQGGKDLKVGIHTVNGAAELLLQGSAFSTLMEAQGAVLYLTKMVKWMLVRILMMIIGVVMMMMIMTLVIIMEISAPGCAVFDQNGKVMLVRIMIIVVIIIQE